MLSYNTTQIFKRLIQEEIIKLPALTVAAAKDRAKTVTGKVMSLDQYENALELALKEAKQEVD